MAAQEFELIERFFKRDSYQRCDVVVGIGDDAALVQVPADKALVVAVGRRRRRNDDWR